MPILRNASGQEHFTIITNNILTSRNISLKAIGMYCKLCSLPDSWNFTESGLTAICKDGKDGVRSALEELEILGVLFRFRIRNSDGTMGDAVYYISNHSLTKDEKKNILGRYNPQNIYIISENPTSENPTLENPDNKILNKSNTNYIKKESKKDTRTFDEIIDNYTSNETLRFELKEHLKTRKAKKATLTNRAIELSCSNLDKLGRNDEEKIEIVRQSIANGWIGFFELKQPVNTIKTKADEDADMERRHQMLREKYGAK